MATQKKNKTKAKGSRSLDAIRKRTTSATKSLSDVDRAREQVEKSESLQPTTFRIQNIKARPEGDTRPLNPGHVVGLAESVAALGLLEPLVVDREGHLLAGGHRRAALRLLLCEPPGRMELLEEMCGSISESKREELAEKLNDLELPLEEDALSAVPVRVIDFDATQDLDRALAIEAAENTQRRDYTSKEVCGIYKRLLEAGYTDRRGKPKKGERPAKPAIAMVIGKSIRTVERILQKAKAQDDQGSPELDNEEMSRALGLLERAIKRVVNCSSRFDELSSVHLLADELRKKKFQRLIQNVRTNLGGEVE